MLWIIHLILSLMCVASTLLSLHIALKFSIKWFEHWDVSHSHFWQHAIHTVQNFQSFSVKTPAIGYFYFWNRGSNWKCIQWQCTYASGFSLSWSVCVCIVRFESITKWFNMHNIKWTLCSRLFAFTFSIPHFLSNVGCCSMFVSVVYTQLLNLCLENSLTKHRCLSLNCLDMCIHWNNMDNGIRVLGSGWPRKYRMEVKVELRITIYVVVSSQRAWTWSFRAGLLCAFMLGLTESDCKLPRF